MADLLESIETFLNDKTEIPATIIDDIEGYPTEIGFPFFGIFDGGDEAGQGASECIHRHLVFIVIYSEVTGSHRDTVLEVRGYWKTLRTLIPQSENFETGAYFDGFSHARYVKSSKVMKTTKNDNDTSYVAMKIPLFEFAELVREEL